MARFRCGWIWVSSCMIKEATSLVLCWALWLPRMVTNMVPATRGLYSPSSGPTGSWCLLPNSSSRASEVPPWLGWGLECAPECWLWPRLARLASISTTGAGARSPAPSSWTESGRGEILKGKLRTVPEVGQSLPSALSHQNVLLHAPLIH